jgi:hypothetical protein
MIEHLVGAEACDQRQPPRLIFGIEQIDQPQQLIGFQGWSAFKPDRIFDAAAEFDMRMIYLPRAVADPQHVSGRAVPVS